MEKSTMRCAVCGREKKSKNPDAGMYDGVFYCFLHEGSGATLQEMHLLNARYPTGDDRLGALVYMANQHQEALQDIEGHLSTIRGILVFILIVSVIAFFINLIF